MRAFLVAFAAISLAAAQAQQENAAPRRAQLKQSNYQVGVGIADITGPVVQITFMGYAVATQKGEGVHMRQRARAFCIHDGNKYVAYVSADAGMGSDVVTQRVVDELKSKLGDIYTYDNVIITGTHTHGTPAGYIQYTMYEFPTNGYIKETTDTYVEGVVNAIVRAHQNLQPGHIRYANGDLVGANINRSPTSYLRNPQSERDEWAKIGDTDKNMLLLRFDADDGTPLGMLNWFAVHGTSMNNTNKLVTGDNRGFASQLFEQHMNGPESIPGEGPFVAAFASTNLGDVSPNTAGPLCRGGKDEGKPCDKYKSTCDGSTKYCWALGPGKDGDMLESTKIIATKQFEHAKQLYDTAKTGPELDGSVDHRHSFVKMAGLKITLDNGTVVHGCPSALGEAFAAGTTDGPGDFDFTQGNTSLNPFWNVVSGVLSKPNAEQRACHYPKPILLNINEMTFPYPWEAPSMPLSVFKVGQLVIVGTPNELTTMSGRRARAAIKEVFQSSEMMAGQDVMVTIAGLSNSYSHYVTTHEEYQAQRYEAASTIYGPHTLQGYIQEFKRLSNDLINGRQSTSASPPPNLESVQKTLQTGVVFDDKPPFTNFGDVLKQPSSSYHASRDTVSVEFRSANLRNNKSRIGDTFLTVDRSEGGKWVTMATDSNWETKLRWKESGAYSYVYIDWEIPSTAKTGTYRICHRGDWKSGWNGHIKSFTGCTHTFAVHNADELLV